MGKKTFKFEQYKELFYIDEDTGESRTDDEIAENFYVTTTKVVEDQFVVAIPWKENMKLSDTSTQDSRRISLARVSNAYRKLDDTHRQIYTQEACKLITQGITLPMAV